MIGPSSETLYMGCRPQHRPGGPQSVGQETPAGKSSPTQTRRNPTFGRHGSDELKPIPLLPAPQKAAAGACGENRPLRGLPAIAAPADRIQAADVSAFISELTLVVVCGPWCSAPRPPFRKKIRVR